MPCHNDSVWTGVCSRIDQRLRMYVCMLVISTHFDFQGMDIADVEVVVVYGILKTAAQLYQVATLAIFSVIKKLIIVHICSVQLFGRAGHKAIAI